MPEAATSLPCSWTWDRRAKAGRKARIRCVRCGFSAETIQVDLLSNHRTCDSDTLLLGDRVARLFSRWGIRPKHKCGCHARQLLLNRLQSRVNAICAACVRAALGGVRLWLWLLSPLLKRLP